MRIIAGEHRGRPIIGPAGAERTRPITDRVKQSLFDRLSASDRLVDAVVADVFCGTGSMGLECLSRGAAHVTFVERDRDAQARLKRNLGAIGAGRRAARILRYDALGQGLGQAMQGVLDRVAGGRRYTLLFVDPPYPMMRHPTQQGRLWRQVDRLREVAAEDALLVLRTPADVEARALERWPHLETHAYKTMKVHLLQ